MAFPAFDPSKRKVLFFSRGRGRGHAIPDIEIIRALERLAPDVQVRIVSYGTGAATFDEFGYSLIDVGLPETSPIAEMSVIAGKLIGGLRPDLVVSHEEFAAAPAARIFDVPVTFIIDFFDDEELYTMGVLRFADEILFTGAAGVFPVPSGLEAKVRFVGPVVRPFTWRREDQARARQELGIGEADFVVTMLPGSWDESRAPSVDLVMEAFDAIEREPKRLVWLAGADEDLIRQRAGRRPVTILGRDWNIDRLMVASDVALTKMNRMTVVELQQLAIPTVSLSWGLNRIDDLAVRGMEGVQSLDAPTLTAGGLATAIMTTCLNGRLAMPAAAESSADTCARYVTAALARPSPEMKRMLGT